MTDNPTALLGVLAGALAGLACGGGGGAEESWDERLADALAPKAESTSLRLVSLSQPEGSTLLAEPHSSGHHVPALWATVSVTTTYADELRIQVFMARDQEYCLAAGAGLGELAGEATVTTHPMIAFTSVTRSGPACALPYTTTEVVVYAAYKGREVTTRRYPATYHFVGP